MSNAKKSLIFIVLGALLYAALTHHLIIIDSGVKILPKSKWSLDYTIYSAHGKTPEGMIAIDDLRRDGIADLLLEAGKLSEERKEFLLSKYEEDAED
jgi:hypothetical protein